MIVCPDSSSVRTRKRRIFLRQTAKCDTHLLLVRLGLRLDCDVDHRLRENHPLERDDRRRIAERLAGGHVLEADTGGDVAGEDLLQFFTIVGVHLQHATDALAAPLDRVVDGVARLEHAGVDANKGQLPDIGVGHQLEGKRRELGAVGRLARIRLAVLQLAGDRRNIDRRRQQIDHRIEHALHALVLESGSAKRRLNLAGDRAIAQTPDDIGLVRSPFSRYGPSILRTTRPPLRPSCRATR
jgi:hypothetical protein